MNSIIDSGTSIIPYFEEPSCSSHTQSNTPYCCCTALDVVEFNQNIVLTRLKVLPENTQFFRLFKVELHAPCKHQILSASSLWLSRL